MVFARRSRKNHANPSLRSGQALKVKPMLDGRLWRKSRHVEAVINYVNLMYDRYSFKKQI